MGCFSRISGRARWILSLLVQIAWCSRAFGTQEKRTYTSHFLFSNFVSHFIWISWISKVLIRLKIFLLVISQANSVPKEFGIDVSRIFTSKCTWSPRMFVPWLYPAPFWILNLSLFADTFHCVFTLEQWPAYLQSILKFFLLLFTFFWFSLHLILKFVIYFHYLHLLNIHCLPGICNSAFILYKLTNDTFFFFVKLHDLFLGASLWILIFLIIFSFLTILHSLFPWLCRNWVSSSLCLFCWTGAFSTP